MLDSRGVLCLHFLTESLQLSVEGGSNYASFPGREHEAQNS